MISRRLFSVLILTFALFSVSNKAIAQHEEGHEPAQHEAAAAGHEGQHEEKKGFNASEVIFGHISDSHYWHLFDVNGEPVSMSLPVMIWHPEKGLSTFSASKFEHGHASHEGYSLQHGMKEKIVSEDGASIIDFSITKNVLSMIISVVLLLWIMLSVAGKYKKNGVMKAPTGMQNALEPVLTFIRDEVGKPNLGHKYMRYMPLLLTIFFFIWINNLLGLLPGGANFTGNIAVTACLAVVAFLVMVFSGNKHFWGHLFNPPGVPLGVKFLLVPIEIISLFIKPIALMIRLFANILAGHIVILSVISMIFIFGALSEVAGWGFVPVSLAFSIFMFFLELLVAAIQAFIFTNLTAVFIGQAIEEGHQHDHAHEDYHAHNPETGQKYNVSKEEIIA
ncbi:F0F1 ATP synthase subunit A [Polluticoccus soli]|uniref:F0F1 ATP synthase subunit A n=1 Tax=Polluticoccus soli TaxID=3034150 RepID=UPI0023E2AA51|nr:F0F1 ATP synthase subunit A [Flavipsychrobacter sp. JY13-12]